MHMREHDKRMKAMRAESERLGKFLNVFLSVVGVAGVVLACFFITVGVIAAFKFLNGDFSR